MRLTISETITDIMEVTEQVSVINIADFDNAVGSVKGIDFDAKGDLLVGTADGVYTRLEVGTNGQKLTARSTETKGVAWESETAIQEDYGVCQGRLTLTTNTPVETGTATGTTVYFTPYKGNLIGLYASDSTGVFWDIYTLAQVGLKTTDAQTGTTVNGSPVITGLTDTSQLWVGMDVSGTGIAGGAVIASIDSGSQVTMGSNATASGSVTVTFKAAVNVPVDIFINRYNGANKLYGVKWTNATTRATALTRQDGIYVLTGDLSKRYLGTVMCSVAGTVYNGVIYRGVFNNYNPVRQKLYVRENTSHTYNGAARLWNNSETDNKLIVLNGLATNIVQMRAEATIKAGADGSYAQIALYANAAILEAGAVAANKNVQPITGAASGDFYPIEGLNTLNVYESSDHNDSSFTGLRLMAEVWM